MHVRELSQRDPKKSRDLLHDVQRLLEDLIPLLPKLFLHPVVWRELELATLYCLSLDEVKGTSLPGRTESLELPLRATGDALQHAPMTLAEYTRVRRGKKGKQVKGGEEKVAKDLQKLQDAVLPALLKQAKEADHANEFNTTLEHSVTPLLSAFLEFALTTSRGVGRRMLRLFASIYRDTAGPTTQAPENNVQRYPVAEDGLTGRLEEGGSEDIHLAPEETNTGIDGGEEHGAHDDTGAPSPVHAPDTQRGGLESPTPGTQAEGVTEHVTDVARNPSATDDPRFDDPRPSRAVAGPDLRAQGTDSEEAPAALDADSAEQPIVLPCDPLPLNEQPEEDAH